MKVSLRTLFDNTVNHTKILVEIHFPSAFYFITVIYMNVWREENITFFDIFHNKK